MVTFSFVGPPHCLECVQQKETEKQKQDENVLTAQTKQDNNQVDVVFHGTQQGNVVPEQWRRNFTVCNHT